MGFVGTTGFVFAGFAIVVFLSKKIAAMIIMGTSTPDERAALKKVVQFKDWVGQVNAFSYSDDPPWMYSRNLISVEDRRKELIGEMREAGIPLWKAKLLGLNKQL
jgi:hypothetical protein